MKKLLVISAIAATSTSAFAFDYKINLEGRADLVNSDTKTTTTATPAVTTTEKWNNFSNGLIRLNMMGVVNESLSYRFRYRFLASAASPTTAREFTNTTNGIDYLFVDHKNEFFTTRFGKQNWAEAAGRESFMSGTDVFLTSAAFSNYKTGFGSDYRYGITAMFKFMDTNNFSVALSNPNSTFSDTNGLATGPEKTNTGLAMAAFYNGNFFEKLVQPVLAYSSSKQNGDKDITASATTQTKDVNYTMYSAGLRSEFSGIVVDADYKEFKKPNKNNDINVTSANKLQTTKSIFANVALNAGSFTPIFTYINDKYTTEETALATDANYKKTSFAFGTYWKPMADVNFRYHLMYTSAVTKYEGLVATNAKIDDKKIYFGFKADI